MNPRTNLCLLLGAVVVLWLGFTTSVTAASQCSLQNGQCTYNINLMPGGGCNDGPGASGLGTQSLDGIKKTDENAPQSIKLTNDGGYMQEMQQDFKIVKSDHENRIKELESSIQRVLRNAIPSGATQYTPRGLYLEPGGVGPEMDRPSRERVQGPSENILMLQLQNQFNRMRSSLSIKSADLVDARNKLNETSDLLKETQRLYFESSKKLGDLETTSAVLERESNILKNKLKIKTEKLEYSTTKLNHSETKLLSLENQLYDVVRSESTLREELATVKMRLEETVRELEELKINHTTLTQKHHKTKKSLRLREEELMECYMAKTQTFCDFEDSNLCGFTQEADNDTFDWVLQQGRTPSANTGPENDHTCKDRNGHYLYIESSGKGRDQNAIMYSPKYRGLTAQCIQFYYHMFGRHTGTLSLHTKLFIEFYIEYKEGQQVCPYFQSLGSRPVRIPRNRGIRTDLDPRLILPYLFQGLLNDELKTIWRVFGNQGNLWIKASVSIPEDTTRDGYQLIFEGSTSVGYEGDISIDDFRIEDGLCENDRNKGTFGITLPPPITREEQRKLLQKQIDLYRKRLRRRQNMRRQRSGR